MSLILCGVINCTPDSFSDGSSHSSPSDLIEYGRRLIGDGAHLLDIGGDSTRPGSLCVGPEEEWRRIAPVIEGLISQIQISVDTHHAEIARRALALGASYINDVGGGSDPHLVRAVAESGASLVVMYSASGVPHVFSTGPKPAEIVSRIEEWFEAKIIDLEAHGLPRERIVLDTGMGAFISTDPESSWHVLSHYERFARFGCALMLGCSRKGFLKGRHERVITDRDPTSALCAAIVVDRLADRVPLLVRAHDIAGHVELCRVYKRIHAR